MIKKILKTNRAWFLFYWIIVFISVVFMVGAIYYASPSQQTIAHNTATKESCHYYLNSGSDDQDCSESALSNYFKEYTWAAREIASAESTCSPEAQGTNDPSKSGFDSSIPRINYDVGLFQINEYWHCGTTHTCEATGESVTLSGTAGGSAPSSACINELKDPKTNKIVACALSSGGKNWNPWATAQPDYCNLVNPGAGNTPPPGDSGNTGGGNTLAGGGCELPTLGPITCGTDFPAIPTPNGPFDLNDICQPGATMTVGAVVLYIYYVSLWFSGIIAFLSLLYAGILYMLSGANPGGRGKAKERLTAVMWGIAILFFAVVFVNFINPDIAKLELTSLATVEPGDAKCISGGGGGPGTIEDVDCSDSFYSCSPSNLGDTCNVQSSCKEGCKPSGELRCSEVNQTMLGNVAENCTILSDPVECIPIEAPGEYHCSWTSAGLCVTAEEYCATGYTTNEDRECESITNPRECMNAQAVQCVPNTGEIACPVLDVSSSNTAYCYNRPPKHNGHDIMADRGTPIYAMEAGTLDRVAWQNAGGCRLWIINTASGRGYAYLHMGWDLSCNTAYAPGIKTGAKVTAGQLLGYVGTTYAGSASGTVPHLHLTVVKPGGSDECPPPASGNYGGPTMNGAPLFEQANCPFN